MKTIGLRFAVQAAILAAVFAAGGRSDGADTAAHPRGEVQAKAEYCKDCHGLSGQGYRGYLPIPRLAGQHPTISKISCAPLSSAGGIATFSSTWRMCTG